jgi:hypothetical protein
MLIDLFEYWLLQVHQQLSVTWAPEGACERGGEIVAHAERGTPRHESGGGDGVCAEEVGVVQCVQRGCTGEVGGSMVHVESDEVS